MALTLCVLGSGSSGNSLYLAAGRTKLLIDAGLTARQTVLRLASLGQSIEDINAVCLTHEHTDHVSGLSAICGKHGIPVYANRGTVEGCLASRQAYDGRWNVFTTGSGFAVGDIDLHPFPVLHDAYEPVGFTVSSGKARMGVVTDLGSATEAVHQGLSRSSLLVVEANHDEGLLADSDRPYALKQRIAGRNGHLSNVHAGELLRSVIGPGIRAVFLAHLSRHCNRPELALGTVKRALLTGGFANVSVELTHADKPSRVVVVE
ncbi:MAG: MBL fold metallo-hydrolase [Kiritimatiellia bacterium]